MARPKKEPETALAVWYENLPQELIALFDRDEAKAEARWAKEEAAEARKKAAKKKSEKTKDRK
jgi:hypothetical protein